MNDPDPINVGEVTLTTVSSVLGLDPTHVAEATALIELPGFDSIAIMAILDRIEDNTGIELPGELIVPDTFESLDRLIDAFTDAGARRREV
ncbi:acyl carrier protein [Arthrobacter sp. E44]|uniref:acyl carrier protein n=1 Tax=Arthrobacter sp. E44 TaxID=3341794 RepID=UPI0035A6B61A